jgi:hypothetical protein
MGDLALEPTDHWMVVIVVKIPEIRIHVAALFTKAVIFV